MKSLLLLLAAATVADAVGVRGKPEREALFASHLGDRPHVDQDEVEGRESRGSLEELAASTYHDPSGKFLDDLQDFDTVPGDRIRVLEDYLYSCPGHCWPSDGQW